MPQFAEFRPVISGIEAEFATLQHMTLRGVPQQLRHTHRIFGADLVAALVQHPNWDLAGTEGFRVLNTLASTVDELRDGYVDRATAQEWVNEQVHKAVRLVNDRSVN